MWYPNKISMKKSNRRSRTDPHNTPLPDYREEVHRKESKQHSKQPTHEHGMICGMRYVMHMHDLQRKDWTWPQLGNPRVPLERWVDFSWNHLIFPVLLLRVGSGNVVLWGFVRLHSFVFFMDSFFFLAGFQARWPYPRNQFYLCLLVARSFAMLILRYLPLAISCFPYC